MKKITLGIVAHVDAGKTTLSEALLYEMGVIRSLGRVDKADSFLDDNPMERERGITIFSKQAILQTEQLHITLLDTPGHVDFSAEMERTLQVLDYAILVLSATDGIQSHTKTLWELLQRYHIPTFIFVNKMDQPGADAGKVMEELRSEFGEGCIDFMNQTDTEEWIEQIAVTREDLLEQYLEQGEWNEEVIPELVRERQVVPCLFGSALKVTGVTELIRALERYTCTYQGGEVFGARVFKITRDEKGMRLTHVKVTSGVLHAKDLIMGEKAHQLRIYSGDKYEMVSQADAGTICAITSLTKTRAGQGLGVEEAVTVPVLEPVLTYSVQLPEELDVQVVLPKLRELEEEFPELHISWEEELGDLKLQLMGQVQIDMIKAIMKERFGFDVTFGTGEILYKETICNTVEGVGHFEPLRHYAEVHLLMEPGEWGSGLQFAVNCREEILEKNWQRLIYTHLEEQIPKGVLTGSPLTDVKITIVSGKAHTKHTEGGDFRQATYRAIRQGLMMANSRLLEPYYQVTIQVPVSLVGRVMTDFEKMHGVLQPPELIGEEAVLCGRGPVRYLQNYQLELTAFSKGLGRIVLRQDGYYPCEEEETIISQIGYEAERDLEHTADSVFCSHGAGVIVPWYEVYERMHVGLTIGNSVAAAGNDMQGMQPVVRNKTVDTITTDEIEEIFQRTYGTSAFTTKLSQYETEEWGNDSMIQKDDGQQTIGETKREQRTKKAGNQRKIMLIDGYNVIYAWDELKALAVTNLDSARAKLQDIVSDYQGYHNIELIIVYDAYKKAGGELREEAYNNITLIFTPEGETADSYIERYAHTMGKNHLVTVVTSDRLEQITVMSQGCSLMSAREFREELQRTKEHMRTHFIQQETALKVTIGEIQKGEGTWDNIES